MLLFESWTTTTCTMMILLVAAFIHEVTTPGKTGKNKKKKKKKNKQKKKTSILLSVQHPEHPLRKLAAWRLLSHCQSSTIGMSCCTVSFKQVRSNEKANNYGLAEQ